VCCIQETCYPAVHYEAGYHPIDKVAPEGKRPNRGMVRGLFGCVRAFLLLQRTNVRLALDHHPPKARTAKGLS
jgi:hypothetical protein